MGVAMAARFHPKLDLSHSILLDGMLILLGALFALAFWPVTHP
jgi:hypothetical protein